MSTVCCCSMKAISASFSNEGMARSSRCFRSNTSIDTNARAMKNGNDCMYAMARSCSSGESATTSRPSFASRNAQKAAAAGPRWAVTTTRSPGSMLVIDGGPNNGCVASRLASGGKISSRSLPGRSFVETTSITTVSRPSRSRMSRRTPASAENGTARMTTSAAATSASEAGRTPSVVCSSLASSVSQTRAFPCRASEDARNCPKWPYPTMPNVSKPMHVGAYPGCPRTLRRKSGSRRPRPRRACRCLACGNLLRRAPFGRPRPVRRHTLVRRRAPARCALARGALACRRALGRGALRGAGPLLRLLGRARRVLAWCALPPRRPLLRCALARRGLRTRASFLRGRLAGTGLPRGRAPRSRVVRLLLRTACLRPRGALLRGRLPGAGLPRPGLANRWASPRPDHRRGRRQLLVRRWRSAGVLRLQLVRAEGASSGAPGGDDDRAEPVGREEERDDEPETGHQRAESQASEAGEERAEPSADPAAMDHQPSEDQGAGDVAERPQHGERPEDGQAERDADNARHDDHAEDGRDDPEEEPEEERRPYSASGDDDGVGGTREQPHEQQPQHRRREGDRQPQQRQDDDDESGKEAVDVELLHVAPDRPARRGRGRAGRDVAMNVRARPYGRLPVEHGDTAVDAPADEGVAVQHERVAGDASIDPEVAATDVHGAVHAAVDPGGPIGGHRRSGDGLAARHDEAAGHADAAAVLVTAVLGAGGMHARQQEHKDNCCRREDSTAHGASVTVGNARFRDARPLRLR